MCLVALCLCVVVSAPASAQSEGAWSLERYQALSAEVAEADAARSASTLGSDSHRLESERALRERRALLTLIDDAIRDGSMPAEFVRPAEEARIVLIQNIVVLLSDLERCAEADAAFALFSDAASDELAQARASATRSLEQCRRVENARNQERARLAAQDPIRPDVPPAQNRPARPRPALAAGVLFGISAGATAGLVVWHLDNQNELDQALAVYNQYLALSSDEVSVEDFNAAVATGQEAERARNTSLGVTIGAGVLSAALMATTVIRAVNGRSRNAASHSRARLIATPTGVAMSW